MQPQQISHPWRVRIYHLANWSWIVSAWIWTTIIIAFLVQFIPNLLTTANVLQGTWISKAIIWLELPNSPLSPEAILRLMAIGLVFLLIAIPPLAFGIKQLLRDVEPKEGIDKLIDVLQQDTISPQLEFLQQQLEQQLQKLEACVQALEGLSNLLQQTPTASNLLMLYTLSQQQHALQKKQLQKVEVGIHSLESISSLLQQMPTSSDLDGLEKGISQILQDVQERTIEQVQRSSNLYKQNSLKVSEDLAKISPLLQQIQKSLETLARPIRGKNGSSSDKDAMIEPSTMDLPPTTGEL